jgi:hypothetical protein
VQADVAKAEDVERLFKESMDAFGRPDVVVKAKGVREHGNFKRKRRTEWETRFLSRVEVQAIGRGFAETLDGKGNQVIISGQRKGRWKRWEEGIRGLSSLNSTSTIPNGTPLQSRASGSQGERYDVRNYWDHWQRWRQPGA